MAGNSKTDSGTLGNGRATGVSALKTQWQPQPTRDAHAASPAAPARGRLFASDAAFFAQLGACSSESPRPSTGASQWLPRQLVNDLCALPQHTSAAVGRLSSGAAGTQVRRKVPNTHIWPKPWRLVGLRGVTPLRITPPVRPRSRECWERDRTRDDEPQIRFGRGHRHVLRRGH